jgi:hypothetical protein
MRALWAVACAAAILGCEDALEVAEAADVRVEANANELIVTNGRPAPIFYFAVDEGRAASLDEWTPCTETPQCPSVPAQTIQRVPYNLILGSRSGGDILFYWWHVMLESTGSREPDSVRVLRVRRR